MLLLEPAKLIFAALSVDTPAGVEADIPNAGAADVALERLKLGKATELPGEAEEVAATDAKANFADEDEEDDAAPKTGADEVDTAEAEACEENNAGTDEGVAEAAAALVVANGAEAGPNANETGFTVGVLEEDEAALPNPNDDGKPEDEGVPKEKLGDDDDDVADAATSCVEEEIVELVENAWLVLEEEEDGNGEEKAEAELDENIGVPDAPAPNSGFVVIVATEEEAVPNSGEVGKDGAVVAPDGADEEVPNKGETGKEGVAVAVVEEEIPDGCECEMEKEDAAAAAAEEGEEEVPIPNGVREKEEGTVAAADEDDDIEEEVAKGGGVVEAAAAEKKDDTAGVDEEGAPPKKAEALEKD